MEDIPRWKMSFEPKLLIEGLIWSQDIWGHDIGRHDIWRHEIWRHEPKMETNIEQNIEQNMIPKLNPILNRVLNSLLHQILNRILNWILNPILKQTSWANARVKLHSQVHFGLWVKIWYRTSTKFVHSCVTWTKSNKVKQRQTKSIKFKQSQKSFKSLVYFKCFKVLPHPDLSCSPLDMSWPNPTWHALSWLFLPCPTLSWPLLSWSVLIWPVMAYPDLSWAVLTNPE